jgi:hypothetical protein
MPCNIIFMLFHIISMPFHIIIMLHNIIFMLLKGTVSQDFWLLVFFMNQFPPSPRIWHKQNIAILSMPRIVAKNFKQS